MRSYLPGKNDLHIEEKKNILFIFGEVKQTINTSIVITMQINTANTHTAVAVRCVDQYEYSLIKIQYTLL
jgi:hypothetical protein